jgi:2,4-diketo-3-deoxy-L-fuconate hydrolase
MEFVRWDEAGRERPGVLGADGTIRDLSGVVPDISGATLGQLRGLTDVDALPEVHGAPRLGPCVSEPIVFFKATSAIAGPDDDLMLPRGARKVDWEVELGVVIGRHVGGIDESEAQAAIAGYCVVNDLSEREWQLERGGQWVKGKSADGFGPLGPWLVTADSIPDVAALRIWLEIDGRRVQDSSTGQMIFKPAYLVSYLSQFMSLQPGDIISTGTPPGVGLGRKPPVYLYAGQEMRLGIDGLGEQRQRVLPPR